MTTHEELLFGLIRATKPSEIDAILRQIGDHPGVLANEPFGENQYIWSFYDGKDTNFSSIHLASKPGRSLTERITNAIDAVLDERMWRGGPAPASPMEAAKLWFGRPPTMSDNGLYKWKDYGLYDYDRLVQVTMLPADEKAEPTVDILDAGIGLLPEEFSSTILSLQRGNKVKKPYLVGAFGQGGASTIRYSKYTLIVSRHVDAPNTVGFTVIKRMRLPDPYKVDAYVYLSVGNPDGSITVPSCQMEGQLDFYPAIPNHSVKLWERGTLVRHYGYDLKGFENPLQASPGNLYHAFQCMMFDPLLPFRLIDLRAPKKGGKYKNEIILGSRNRLMKYTLKGAAEQDSPEEIEDTEDDNSGPKPQTILRHHSERQMVSLRSDASPNVGIEYWVMFVERKSGDKIGLRRSSELYVERDHPILGTLNGQNQGDRTDTMFRELELSTVSKHIVVHVDASGADRDTRLGLFVSTREGFAEGSEFKELIRILTEILKEDEELYSIEHELVQAVINRQTAGIDSEVKKELAELLRDAGLEMKQPGSTVVPGEGAERIPSIPKGWKPHIPERPLPTLPYPQVTKLKIVYPVEAFEIPVNERHAVKIETDADYRFDREDRLAIRSEPPNLEVATKGEMRGGRLKWRLRPKEDAKVGDIGEVIVTLTKPDGSQLEDRTVYEVMPSREVKGKKARGLLPDFDIQPIDPYNERDLMERLWPDAKGDDIPRLAYKADKFEGKIIVYYSTSFEPFKAQFERLKNQPALAELFQHDYKIWIGYHAILQLMFHNNLVLDPQPDGETMNMLDRYIPQIEGQSEEKERALVAEMQVKQAFKSALAKHEAMKESAN